MATYQAQIPITQPVMEWTSTNMHEAFKRFRKHVKRLLIDGPFKKMAGEEKVSLLLDWLGSEGDRVFDEELSYENPDEDKKDLTKVLDAFEAHFIPVQGMVQSWYSLGNLYSNPVSYTHLTLPTKRIV